MKHTGLLAGFILIIILTSGPHYQIADREETEQSISTYDEVFEKTVITLRRRNTEEVSLLSARRYKTGYQFAVIRTDSLKKAGNYQAVFDTLDIYFPASPASIVYYEELISTGAGSGNLLLIKNKLDEIRDRPLTPYEEYARGIIMNLRGNIDSAITLFSGIIRRYPELTIVYLRYANALKDKGRYAEARQALKKFFTADNDDSYLHAEAVLLQGTIAFLGGEYDQAMKYYRQAEKLSDELYDIHTGSRARINQGLVYDIYGEYDPARELFNKGIEGAKRLKDPELLAYGYSELGVSYSFTSDYPDALGHYQEAITIYLKTGNSLRLSYLYSNRGNLQNAMGNYAGALASYRAGVEASGDAPRPLIQNLTGMADVYVNAGNYTQAIRHYHEAMQLAKKINDKDLLSSIETGSGSFKLNLGAYEAAEEHFRRALIYTDAKSNPLQAGDIMDKLALSLKGQGKTDSAIILLQEAIRTVKKYQDIILLAAASQHLAEIYHEEGEAAKALGILAEIRKSIPAETYPQQHAEAVITEADIRLQTDNASEAHNLLSSTGVAELTGNNAYLALYYHSVHTRALITLGNRAEAEKELQDAIALYERTAQSLIGGSHDIPGLTKLASGLYNSQIQLLNEKGDYKTAFGYLERKNGGSAFRNVISLTLAQSMDNPDLLDKLYSLAWTAESQIHTQTERDSALQLYNSLLAFLALQKPVSMKMLTVTEMQSALEEDEYIIALHTTEDSSYIYALGRNEFLTRKIKGGENSLRRIKRGISPNYDRRPGSPDFLNRELFAFDAVAARYLYKHLFGFLNDKLEKGSRLIILPDNIFRDFPFETLVVNSDDENNSFHYEACEFAGERYRFVYTPSFSAYKGLEKINYSKNKTSLLVGNPLVSSSSRGFAERRSIQGNTDGSNTKQFLPLKYSAEEVNSIDNMLDFSTVLTGSFATESRFRELAADASLIHLSAHSSVTKNQPVIYFSGLYDAEHDGILEPGEIASLGLKSEMVVLSSCSSGLGDPDAEEGVTGLNRALIEGGAKSVISTLWEINDEYTSRFMEMFYDHLSVGISKSEALRRTRSDFISQVNSDPYYWGAFILYGADSPMHIEKKNYIFIMFQYLSIGFAGAFVLLVYIRRLTRQLVIRS
ncbi:MAG: hypothetical protein FMNOHCHN_00369 [Ignavibacteriaceae bacterium]|nr:hypothetical protein [Ignavibacteriaceae bacterium]